MKRPSIRHRLLRTFVCACTLACASATSHAETNADHAVRATAVPLASPPTLQLRWPARADATAYTISRRAPSESTWGLPLVTIPSSSSGFSVSSSTSATTLTGWDDTTIAPGVAYEYQIVATTTTNNSTGGGNVSARSYLLAALDAPLVEARGTLLLLIDQSVRAPLTAELDRFVLDLVGDGWRVVSQAVPRHRVNTTGWKDAVVANRELIRATRLADPGLVGVVLFGHVPVPYSGTTHAPDGHSDHAGAWPADVYYADLDGTWSDVVTATTATRPENQNRPGDGKFDTNALSFGNDAELFVGRIDLSDLPAFAPSEVELLRAYLNKNHRYRHGLVPTVRRGLIDANIGSNLTGKHSAAAFRSFSALFSPANIIEADYFTTLATQDYQFAYADGGGTFTSMVGVGNTANYVTSPPRAIFNSLFGSYFADWDNQNNLLRAPLASAGPALASSWNGRPFWNFHPLGLGQTLGYVARATLNNNPFTNYHSPNLTTGVRGVHIALMGDPSLRLHPVSPPASLALAASGDAARLSWTAPAASPAPAPALIGYHVYRAPARLGPYTRLTGTPISPSSPHGATLDALSYDDPLPSAPGTRFYQVRAVYLQTGSTGTYFNQSQGRFVDDAPPPAPTIADGQTASGFVGEALSYPLIASAQPTAFALASGTLPPGLTLDAATGFITGTPTQPGTFTPVFTAQNTQGLSLPVAVTFTLAARPRLLARESFLYPTGSGALTNRDGGTGWGGPWSSASNDIVSPGLTYTQGGATLLTAGARASLRHETASFRALPARFEQGTYWLSVLARASVSGAGYGGLSLFDGGGERLFIGQRFNQASWGLERAGSPGLTSAAPANTTAFLVAKLVLRSGPDDVFLWINPTTPDDLLDEETALALTNVADFRFDRIRLLHGLGSGRTLELDEIRLGHTASEVFQPQNPLAAFRATHGLPADGSADLATPADDGVANLLKYAFNLIGPGPTQAPDLATPHSAILPNGGTSGLPRLAPPLAPDQGLRLTYLRRRADSAPGITYAAEFTSDLLTAWLAEPATTEVVTPLDLDFERIEITAPAPTANRQFGRIRVSILTP